jgi:hypothetical protein
MSPTITPTDFDDFDAEPGIITATAVPPEVTGTPVCTDVTDVDTTTVEAPDLEAPSSTITSLPTAPDDACAESTGMVTEVPQAVSPTITSTPADDFDAEPGITGEVMSPTALSPPHPPPTLTLSLPPPGR